MRTILSRLAALALSLVLALLGGELGLRVLGYDRTYVNPLHSFHATDPVLGYRGRRDFEGRFAPPGKFDVYVKHDAGGFRVQEHAKPEAACERRVQVYGDSFAWGWGVDQGEVFTDLLNRDVDGACVSNYGVNASGTVMQYTLFEQEGLARLQPGDVVLVLFCFNDFEDNWEQDREVTAVIEDGEVRRVPPKKPFQTPLRSFMKQHSYVYSLFSLGGVYWKQIREHREAERVVTQHAEVASSDPRVVVTEHFLGEFRARAEERGARFVLAYIPMEGEFGEREDPGGVGRAYRTAVEGVVERLDLDTIELLPEFRSFKAEHPDEMLLLDADRHWGPRGHALVAEVIGRWLAEVAPRAAPRPLSSPR